MGPRQSTQEAQVPVQQTRGHAGKALLISSVSVVILLGVLFLVAHAASRGSVTIRLGDDRFDAGRVSHLAAEVDDGHGLPILYGDLIGKGRNLFVQHTGSDDDAGWVAFGAFDPDDPSCAITIDQARTHIVGTCPPHRQYPLDGQGLRKYPVTVEDGHLFIDLNELSTSTSSTPSTSPTS
jgi:hypothetical protein